MIDVSLLNLLPPLRRARGERLYGPNQKHWVDLWKQDGAWLLGHRPEGVAREWKNQIDKGLGGWAPSLWPRRLEALAPRLVSGLGAVRVFRNADRAPDLDAWRPWDDQPPATAGADFTGALRLVLPGGPCQAVAVGYSSAWRGSLPDHDVTSPAESAALVRAAADVIRLTADSRAVAARRAAGAAFDRHLGPTGLFRRRGVWFDALVADYASLFKAHLAAGFLLNPDASAPSLVPLDLSDGEWGAWRSAAEAWKRERT